MRSGAIRAERWVDGDPPRLLRLADTFALFGPRLAIAEQERVSVAYLAHDARLLLIADVAKGGRCDAPLPIARILRDAVLCGADAIILAHNHPGGDPTPSHADIRATRRLAGAAMAIGIGLTDHVAMASSGFRSFRMMGLL